jgi:hypothetical protein
VGSLESYLDFERLESIEPDLFRSQKPFPWLSPERLLRPEGWAELERDLPALEDCERRFGEARRDGQDPHDRYSLEFNDAVELTDSWRRFIGELRGERYRSHICRLFGVRKVEFRFHWHYTPAGCSVSPHIDAVREYGSHIFYFNSPAWQPQWGGQTLILDDGGRFARGGVPAFGDFAQIIPAECEAGRSLLFRRGDHAWHGMRELSCPAGFMRRVFIVVINPVSIFWKSRDRLIGKTIQRY